GTFARPHEPRRERRRSASARYRSWPAPVVCNFGLEGAAPRTVPSVTPEPLAHLQSDVRAREADVAQLPVAELRELAALDGPCQTSADPGRDKAGAIDEGAWARRFRPKYDMGGFVALGHLRDVSGSSHR